MCLAMNPDKLPPDERCASTSNRNFEGPPGLQGPHPPRLAGDGGGGRDRGPFRGCAGVEVGGVPIPTSLRWPAAYPGTNPGITCAGWLASQTAIGSWHGRNHHNFNEHPRSPKVGREASPRRRVCRIDPLVPNRIVIFEQTHVSDPDLGA